MPAHAARRGGSFGAAAFPADEAEAEAHSWRKRTSTATLASLCAAQPSEGARRVALLVQGELACVRGRPHVFRLPSGSRYRNAEGRSVFTEDGLEGGGAAILDAVAAVVQVFAGIGGLVGCMILFRVPCGCRGPVWARMFFPLMRQCIAEMAFDVLRALRPTLPRLQTVAGICTYAFVVHQLLLGGALQQRVVTGLTLLLGLISWAPPTSPPVPSAVKRLRGGDDALARLRGGARTEDLSTLPGRILRVFWNVVLFSVAFAVYPISPAICVNTSHKMLPTYLLPPWLVLIVLPCSLHEWDKHLKELRKWKSIHEPDGNDRRPPLSA